MLKLHFTYSFTFSYVDDLDSVDDTEKYVSPPFLCLVEEQQNEQKDRVKIGMISVSPRTGDIIWDEFEGAFFHKSCDLLIEVARRSDETRT